MKTLKLRAHHGMCIANFVGKGYDEAFTENMKAVIARLSAKPDTIVEIVDYEDVLCAYCPKRTGVKGCQSGGNVSGGDIRGEDVAKCEFKGDGNSKPSSCPGAKKRDRETIEICGLNVGSKLTWESYSQLIREKVFEAREFEKLCSSCQWYELCTEVSFKVE